MKNKKLNMILLFIIIVALFLTFGYIYHKNKKNHFILTQEKRIDLYFKYNLKNYHGLKITKFQKGPMGSYSAKGYINNNKKYKFQAFIGLGDDKNQYNSDFEYNQEKIGELLKEKDAKDRLTVDEIIEKEHLDKSEYEAEPPLFFFSGPIE
ncbi:DUF1433 domain-containing protein [Staphylococcus aureus]|nr:DUF1433 domain-containing protein [Staphylococcus aureus]HDP6144758.1 DUF1433 domain-containing protein [Staphylococcus aureus]